MSAKSIRSEVNANDQLLLALYDEFAEFHAYCSFFCDATAALCENREEWLDDESSQGLALFSQWLKTRSQSLRNELEIAWKATGQNSLN